MKRPIRQAWRGIALAPIAVASATALSQLLDAQSALQAPALPFFLAVLVSAWAGGLAPGLLATLLGVIVLKLLLMSPPWSLEITAYQAVLLALYAAVGALISVLFEFAYRNSTRAQRLALLVDHAQDAIFEWTLDGTITSWNRAAERLYGHPTHEALGQSPARLLDTQYPEPWSAIRRRLIEEGYWEGELRNTARNGRQVVVEARIALTRDADFPALLVESDRDITSRKRAEDAVRDSEGRFRAVFESHLMGFSIFDAVSGETLAVNDALLAMTGHAREQFESGDWKWREFTPAEYLSLDEHAIQQVRTRGWADPFEKELIRRDGSRFPIRISSAPLPGRPGLIIVAVQDLSHQKRAELATRIANRELAESEARFRATFENAAVGIARVGLDGRWLQVNEALCALTGYTREELLARTFADITHPEDVPADWDYANRLVSGEIETYTMEKRYVRKDGDIVWVMLTVSLVRGAGGRPDCFISAVKDISEQKLAEQALRESEQRHRLLSEQQAVLLKSIEQRALQLRKLADVATQVSAAHDVDAILRLVTEESRELIGAHQAVASLTADRNASQTIHTVSLSDKYAAWRHYDERPDGSGIYSLVCRSNRIFRLTQAELEAHPAWRGFGRHAERHPPMRGWLAVPLVRRDGRNLGLLQLSDKYEGEFLAEDEAILVQLARLASTAVENAQLYEELRRANQRKDEFLATLAHELRNPLAPIRNAAQILKTPTATSSHYEWSRDVIDRQVRHMARLLEDLLDISRITRGTLELRKERLTVGAVIELALEMVQPLIAAKGHALQVDLPDEPLQIDADPVRMTQILGNLLNNAIKYTEPGGRIRIHAEREDATVVIRLQDDGMGIAPDMLSRIFEMFTQVSGPGSSSAGGLGVGLAITRGLIELHGGTIEAHSDGPGRGSEFTVRLPGASEAPGNP